MEQYQVTSSPADGQGQVILQTMPAQMVASGTQSPGQPQVRNSTKLGQLQSLRVAPECWGKEKH